MEIDYKAVIEIIESFLQNEKIQITGISCGKEYEFRTAIENLLKAHKEDEAVIEEMAEYIGDLDIDEDICKKRINDCYVDMYDDKVCKDCVKDFFRNKAKEKKNNGKSKRRRTK